MRRGNKVKRQFSLTILVTSHGRCKKHDCFRQQFHCRHFFHNQAGLRVLNFGRPLHCVHCGEQKTCTDLWRRYRVKKNFIYIMTLAIKPVGLLNLCFEAFGYRVLNRIPALGRVRSKRHEQSPHQKYSILYFLIAHNALCLPPKFCIFCCEMLLGICRPPKRISQQQFMRNLGGNRVHYGQLENSQQERSVPIRSSTL